MAEKKARAGAVVQRRPHLLRCLPLISPSMLFSLGLLLANQDTELTQIHSATWAAASPVGSQSLGALRSASTGDVEASYTSYGPDGPDGLEADPWGTHLELDHPRGLDTAAWAATSPVGSLSRGAQRNAPAGDAEANYTTTGLDGPPRTWSCGAPDRVGSASAASQVGIRTAGTHAPAGMHEAYD